MKTASLKERILLLFILLAGCLLRFYNISQQSFWLDELHTAIEADPALSWSALGEYLKCCDQHPPLFFILEKTLFTIFGSSEFVARSLSAISGMIGIWVVFLLGTKLYTVRLGLVAAALTSFNYFHILYSQEARPYAMAFLFASLSFLYLIHLIKKPTLKNSLLHALFTLLLIGTHYFGLFVFASQIVIAILFWIYEKEEKKKLFKYLFVSALIIGICYSPWLPFLSTMTSIKSFWIQPVAQSFATDFFYNYFGNSDVLKPFILLFFIVSLLQIFLQVNDQKNLEKDSQLLFAFIICFGWIVISYLIPYLRSLLVVPMLYPRYSIVLLPAFIIILSFGIELIKNAFIKYSILIVFVVLSLIDILFVKEYYTKQSKGQFREMAAFVSADSSLIFPVYGGSTGWHQQYYNKQFGNTAKITEDRLDGNLNLFLDSVGNARMPGFWLTGGQGSKKPDIHELKQLESGYLLVKSADFYETWAQLYLDKKKAADKLMMLNYTTFSPYQTFTLNGDTVVAIWDKQVVSNTIKLNKGKYRVNFELKGDKALDVFPHLEIRIDDYSIGQCDVTAFFEFYTFNLEINEDQESEITIIMHNDAVNSDSKEDRNAFIKSISFMKQ